MERVVDAQKRQGSGRASETRRKREGVTLKPARTQRDGRRQVLISGPVDGSLD